MDPVRQLRKRLKSIPPEHDTPVGLIHPYWARKPLNIVTEIVRALSEPGDVIADPFLGSGTTVFAALREKRSVVASDLNPLATFLVQTTLSLDEEVLARVRSFVTNWSQQVLPWFQWNGNGEFVERERFHVHGSYEDGGFSLEPTEVVVKSLQKGQWRNRRALAPTGAWRNRARPMDLLSDPIDFAACRLRPNSRIAILSGATLAHYFTEENRAAINLALAMVAQEKLGERERQAIRLLISSAFPLLRLSDKKASSQWPYWRPKQSLTSRNPVIVVEQRLAAMEDAAKWVHAHLRNVTSSTVEQVVARPSTPSAAISTLPVQRLNANPALQETVDLIVTDPPYADQAPYLEYSALWVQILKLKLDASAYRSEIVKTDAPDRKRDSENYLPRLTEGLGACASVLRTGGYLVWFYQDTDLQHWAEISKAADRNQLRIEDVIPLPKQRRSMKTVTSPGKTLDGDLLLVFRKTAAGDRSREAKNGEEAARAALSALGRSATLFEQYAALIGVGFVHSCFSSWAAQESDVRRWIRSITQEA